MLHRGDSFGEMALLDGDGPHRDRAGEQPGAGAAARTAASSPRSTRSHPEVRAAFETLARHAVALELLPRPLELRARSRTRRSALLVAGARARRRRRRRARRARGRPARADVRHRGGPRCAPSSVDDGDERDLEYLRKGDFFGERVALPRTSRARRASRRSSTARCCASRPSSSARLLARAPRVPARGSRSGSSSTTTGALARVPLDFADEILPADASVAEHGRRRRRPRRRRTTPPSSSAAEPARRRGAPIRRVPARLPARRDGLRRRLPRDGLPPLRPRRRDLAHPRARAHVDRRDDAGRDHARRRGARARRALGARVEEPARRAAAAGGRALGGKPLGRRSTASTTSTSAIADPGARAAPPPARGVPRELERLRVGRRLRRAASSDAPESRPSLAWLKPFLRPHLRLVLFAVGLAIARGRRSSSCCRS